MSLLLAFALAVAPPALPAPRPTAPDAAPQAPAQQPTPLQRAAQLVRQGRPAQALALLDPLVAAEPENAQAWYLKGVCHHTLHQWDQAMPAHEKAASFPATAANASYNLGCAWALQGDAEQAFAWLARARDAGFAGLAGMWGDGDLVALRDDPRFVELAGPRPDYDHPFVEPVRVLHAWHGEGPNQQFGWVAADAGDVDGDGVHDVVTSAPFLVPSDAPGAPSGRVYVFSGKSGAELRRHTGRVGDQLGLAVAGVGDLDGDGHADYAATAPRTGDATATGRVVVWSGATGAVLLELAGEAPGDGFGREVERAFDVDGDGVDELLVGSPACGGGRGLVTLHSGADGARLASWRGEGASDGFGSTVAAGGAGAHRLLVIGAMTAGAAGKGRVVVLRFDPQTRAFVEHFRAEADAENVHLGRFFSSVCGDASGDGVPDVYAVDFEASSGAGQVRLYSGADGALLWKRDGAPGEGLGIGNAIAGDANGDGRADLVTGAWTHGSAAPQGGRCYLLSGADGATLRTWTGTLPGATLGFDSTSLPDCDGDGRRDYLVTAAWSSVRGPKTGSVFLWSGAAPE